MQAAILEKLEIELNKTIINEPQVLYILAEIRKYIEEYEPSNRNNYLNLYFFCNWVLHIKMSRSHSKEYLQELEDRLGDVNSKSIKDITKDFVDKNGSFYLFIDLKNELEMFIKLHTLPNKIVKNDNNWYRFVYYLFQILKDCSVFNDQGKIVQFSFEEKDKQICFRLRKERGSAVAILKDETKKIRKALGDKY